MCSNINGLRNNFVELKYVITLRKPDIFFLNETHLTESCDISDLRIKIYQLINCMSHSKHTGGVSVFVKNNFKFKNIKNISEYSAWYLSFETTFNGTQTIFASVYLSSRSELKQQTLESFEKWYESISMNKTAVICGDFNINMNATHSIYKRRLLNFCDDNGLRQLVDSPTRITTESATVIDLCLSNLNRKFISC